MLSQGRAHSLLFLVVTLMALLEGGPARVFAVETPVRRPVIGIRAITPETVEPTPWSRIAPGRFRVTRVGDTNEALLLLVTYSGTATRSRDFLDPGSAFRMEAGETSLEIVVGPINDEVREADETVVATLQEPPLDRVPNYGIDPGQASAMVTIHDNGLESEWPLVAIETLRVPEKTGEPCPTCLVAPGVVVLRRSGSTVEPLRVYLDADGTATPGVDYQQLPPSVVIPAGTNAVPVLIAGLDDRLAEGPEVVRVRIDRPPELARLGYRVDPTARHAFVVIGDDEPGAPEARLDLLEPASGAVFAAGAPVELEAWSVDTRGEVKEVQFLADGVVVGRAIGDVLGRPPIPCRPALHPGVWSDPRPGRTILIARGTDAEGNRIESLPVTVTIESQTVLPVVRIKATQPIAEETSFPLRRLAFRGELTISRTGPTNEPLAIFVLYSGLATSGVDYPSLPFLVSIPAGADATTLDIVPNVDDVPEGIETLVATLSHCPPETQPPMGIPCYLNSEIDPTQERATVFLRDDGITEASLRLVQPRDGSFYGLGQTILLEANAIDLDGYFSRVEFFADERRIGESEIFFIRAPDPGTLITHGFAWSTAEIGRHALTARAVRSDGTAVVSPVVSVSVGPAGPQPVLQFLEPNRNALYSTRDEIPIVLRGWASNDVFLSAEIFADGEKIAEATYCCWLCRCAAPQSGEETILRIPTRPVLGVPERLWQGWTRDRAGIVHLTARAKGQFGTIVEAAPVRVLIYDPTLHISVRPDGTVGLVVPEGSVAPGRYEAEASSDLSSWTRLGEFQPGNVAAFFVDPTPADARRRRFYRSVFFPALLP